MLTDIPYGSTLAAPGDNPVRTDYKFSGWYKEAGCVTEWSFGDDTVVGLTELYAKWTAKEPVIISEAAQDFTYDGFAKNYEIIGMPGEGFTITYNQGSDDINPIDAGIYNVVLSRAEDGTYASYSKTITDGLVITPATISEAAITGVAAPVRGATHSTDFFEAEQYYGTVIWNPSDDTFKADTVYTATISLTPKSNYTLNGVPANFYILAGAATTNEVNSGVVTAVFLRTEGFGGGGGGGNGGGSGSSTLQTYSADVRSGNGTKATLPVLVNEDTGTAYIDISFQNREFDGTAITIPSIPNVDTYSVGILVPYLSESDGQNTLTINTEVVSISIPSNMLSGLKDIGGSVVRINITQGDKDSLPNNVKDAIGNRPLVRFTLLIDGKQIDWSNPDATVMVSLPYTPTTEELASAESILIWYIDGSGNLLCVPNGQYDPVTGAVTFYTNHFSLYGVGYNPVSFKDVAPTTWYSKAVNFIAARGITGGTGNGNYSPNAKLTRGDCLTLLMRAYGITPDVHPTDNFSDAGDTYYTGYLAAAKRLGIAGGTGNNLFEPNKQITRQEMFSMLYNILKQLGELPSAGTSGKGLADFSDADAVAEWAKDAMSLFVINGIVSGSDSRLNPTGLSDRAQMAQVLYNLLLK